jgi:tetratricopeptide (TPR) repeat protein
MLLERAFALDPDSPEALEGLEAVALDAGDHARLADILERKLEVAARGPVEKKEILVRLADIYDGPLSRPDRARATHERALAMDPDFAASRLWLGRDAWVRGDVTGAARDIARALETAPGGAVAIDLLGNDESLSALVATERARLRLAGTSGAAGALDVLRAIPTAKLSDEGLVLLADLGERERQLADALPALEELRARARAAKHATEELDARIRSLSGAPPEREVPTIQDLERQVSSNPSDYAAVGESAEASGDLERAEQAYWRAAQTEAEPARRANYLCAHARVLLARGELKEAFGELTAALDLAPRHVGALALLADLCFRTQDWERAHKLYAMLEAAPDAADVIPRTELVHRCAALAIRAGDTDQGEALYRELAILNPQNAEARGALAELARARGDVKTAAQRLEEVLRLLPQDAGTELNEVRQRLGAVYAEMGEWAAARTSLELVLAHDPARTSALETLVDAYENLAMFEAAAEVCGRLSRLYTQPARRAAALYRQAEILRVRMGDTDAALDAYLRSSDLDPFFVPARLRLVDQFWAAGDLDVVADLANDLRGVPLSPTDSGPLVVRLAIASASMRRDRGAPSASPFVGFPTLAVEAARALAEAADQQQKSKNRRVGALDPMLSKARSWAGSGESVMVRALTDLVLEDPTRPGPAVALARLAEISGRRALAGAAYALPAFLEPDGSAARQLASLVPPGLVRPEAVRIGGPVDHPGFAGPARRALARLAPALLGFGTERPAPKPTEGSGLPLSRAAELRRIGELLDAPAFVVAPDVVESETADDRRRLRVVLTQPAGLMVAAGAATLSENAWSFIAARALETLRSGLWMAGLAGAEGLARLLEGARSVLRDNHVDDPRSKTVAEWLRQPQAAIFLGPPEERVETLAAVEAALAALPDWTALTHGAQHTRNRIGLIACANPGAALAMIKAEDRTPSSAGESLDARRDFLRRAAQGDLIRFMFSPSYEAAFS